MKRRAVRFLFGAALALLIGAGKAAAHFRVNDGATVTVRNSAVIRSSGNIVINGVMRAGDASGVQWRLTGDWIKGPNGIFVAAQSTVTFYDVRRSSIVGSTTFYNLVCTVPNKELFFQFHSTQGIQGLMTMRGTTGNEVRLRSTESPKKWFIRPTSPQTVDYVDVQDADGLDNGITCVDSIDSGNNNALIIFPIPPPPANVKFFAVDVDSASVSWTQRTGTSYAMALSTASDFSTVLSSGVSAVNQNTTSYANLNSNATYYFKVKISTNNDLSYSLPTSTVTLARSPSVAGFQIFNTSATVTLNPSGNRAGTQLSITTGNFETSSSSSGASLAGNTSFTIFGLTANSTYTIQARAVSFLNVPSSATLVASTATYPNAPANTSFAAVNMSSISVVWSANGNPLTPPTSYQMEISTSADFAAGSSSDTFLINGASSTLSPNTSYYFRAKAYGVGGSDSAYDLSIATFTLASSPGAVSYAAYKTSITVTLAGDNPAGTLLSISSGSFQLSDSSSGYKDAGDTTLTLVNLEPNTPYSIYARAVNFNNLPSTATLAASTVTAAFEVTIVGFDVYTASASVIIGANGNPNGTQLVVSTGAGDHFGVALSSVSRISGPQTTVTLFGLSTNTAYGIIAGNLNPDGSTSAVVVTASTATLSAPPRADGFVMYNASAAVNLDLNTNPAGTILEISSGNYEASASSSGAVTAFELAGLVANTTYTLVARSINLTGAPSPSVIVAATATYAYPPGDFAAVAPADLGVSSIAVSWTANGNPLLPPTSYQVEVATSSDFAAATASQTFTLSMATSALTANATYYFRAAAFNRMGGMSAYNQVIATSTLARAPIFTAVSGVTTGQITVNWDKQGNAASTVYRVERSTAASFDGASDLTLSGADAGSFDFGGLSANVTYYFQGFVLNNHGVAAPFTSSLSTVTLGEIPSPLPFTAAQVTASSITFAWQDNGNASGTLYRVQISTDSGFGVYTASQTSSNLSIATAALGANVNYYFRVRAVNHQQLETDWSGAASTATLAATPSFTAFAGPHVTTGSIQANWNQQGNSVATVYSIRASTSASLNGAGDQTFNGVNSSNRQFHGLSANTSYYFSGFATNVNGITTAFSGAISTPTLTRDPILNVPNWEAADVGVNLSTARWTANDNPSGTLYLVRFATSSGFAGTLTSSQTANVFASTGSLLGNTTIAFQVAAVNHSGRLSAFAASESTATLAATVNFNFFTNVTTGQIRANWDIAVNAAQTRYRVNRSTSASFDGAGDDLLVGVDITSWTSGNLLPNVTHYFRGAAINHGGLEAPMNPAVISTSTLALSPDFTGFTSVTTGQIEIGWNKNGNSASTRYVIDLSSFPGFANPGDRLASGYDLSSATFGSLSPNVTYYLRGTAYNNNGVAAAFGSQVSTVTLASQPSLAVPSFINVEASSLTVQWGTGGNSPGTVYIVDISSTSDYSGAVTSSETAILSISTAGLYVNELYYARVKARNSQGIESLYTNLGSTSTLALAADFLAFDLGHVSTSSLLVRWTGNGNRDFTRYRIEMSSVSDFSGVKTTSDTFILSLLSLGLSANTTYYIRGTAFNVVDAGTPFLTSPSTSTLAAAPSFTAFTGGDATASSLNARWNTAGNSPSTVYRISRSSDPGMGAPVEIALATGAANYSFAGLAPNVTHYFTGVAVNNNGLTVNFTNGTSTSTLAQPPAAAAFSGVGSEALTANWTANGNSTTTRYNVELHSAAGFGNLVSSQTTYGSSATFAGLIPETTYYARALAANHNGLMTAFVDLGSTRTADVPPANVSDLTALAQGEEGFVRLSWTVPGDDGTVRALTGAYRLKWRQTDFTAFTSTEAFDLEIATSGAVAGSAAGHLLTGLEYGATYYAAVIARDEAGNWSRWSKGGSTNAASWVISPDIIPPQVSTITSLGLEGEIVLNWSASTGTDLAAYRIYMDTSAPADVFVATMTVSSSAVSQSLTGLTVNNLYFFYVTALDKGFPLTADAGNSLESLASVITATRPVGGPLAPSDLTHVDATSTTIRWQWTDNSTREEEFRLYNATSGALVATVSSAAASGSTVSYLEQNLSPNVSYSRRVVSFLAGLGESPYSNTHTKVTSAAVPTGEFVSSIDTDTVRIGWLDGANPVVPRTSYYAEAATDDAFSAVVQSTVTASLLGVLKPLNGNSTYFFRVAAISDEGVYTPFGAASLSTVTLAAPGRFNAFDPADVGTATINAEWSGQGNSLTTLYRIAVSSKSDFSVATTTDETYNFFVTTAALQPNVTYYFRGEAVNNQGRVTAFSSPISTPTRANPPAAGLLSNISTNALTADWTANGNAPDSLYVAEVSTSANFVPAFSSATYNLLSAFSGLTPNTTYLARVRVIQRDGSGTSYASLGSTVTLANPGIFTAFSSQTVKAASLNVTWAANNNSAETKYRIEHSTAPDFSGTLGVNQVAALQVQVSTLSPNTTYYVRGVAVNHRGLTADFVAETATATLAYPPAFAAVSLQSTSSFRANWLSGGNPPSVYYVCELSTSSVFASVLQTSVTYNLFADFSNVTPEIAHYLRVKAGNFHNLFSTSTSLGSVTTLGVEPSNIVDVTALSPSVVDGRVNLRWSSPGDDGATGSLSNGAYRIFYSTSDFFAFNSSSPYILEFSTNGSAPGTGVGITLSQLESGATLYFSVIARDKFGNWNTWSKDATHNTANWCLVYDTAPAQLSNFTIQSGDSLIEVSWDASADHDADYYNIYESSFSGVEGFSLIASTRGVSYISDGLVPFNTYYYFTTVVDKGAPTYLGTALESQRTLTQIVVSTQPVFPQAVLLGQSVALTTSSIQWVWCDQAITESGYRLIDPMFPTVFIATTPNVIPAGNPVCGSPSIFREGNTTSYVETNLADNTSYSRFIQVFKPGITANSLSTATLFTLARPPEDLGSVGVSSYSVSLSWTGTGATGYRLERSLNGSVWTFLTTAAASNHNDIGLSAGTTYFYRARAINGDGVLNLVNLSNVISTITYPAQLFNFTGAALSSASILWNWTNADPNAGIRLYNADQTVAASLNAGSTYYYETGFGVNESTSRYVRAFNSSGESVASSSVTVYTLSNPASSFYVLSVLSNSIDLAWGADGNPPYTRYELEQSPNNVAWASLGSQIRATTHTASGLADNQTYYFRIRSFNEDGLDSALAFVSTRTVAIAPSTAPTLAAASISTVAVVWSWPELVANHDGFRVISTTGGAISTALTPDSTYYLQSGLSPNTSHSVYLQVFNTVGSTVSLPISTHTLANPATGLAFSTSSNRGVTLTWSPNANPADTRFSLQRLSVTDVVLAVTGPTTQYYLSDNSLDEGTTYQFKVVSLNERGAETLSSTVSIVTGRIAPSNVTDLLASPGPLEGNVLLDWTVPGDDGTSLTMPSGSSYRLRASVNPIANFDTASPVDYDVSNATSGAAPGTRAGTVIYNLTFGATYHWAIVYTDSAGNRSNWITSGSTLNSVVVPDFTPDPVTGLAGSGSEDLDIGISWTAHPATDIHYYRIYRSSVGASSGFVAIATTSALSYTDASALVPGNSYYYFVNAVDRGLPAFPGNALESSSGTMVSAWTRIRPQFSLPHSMPASSLALNWSWIDTSNKELGYQILATTGGALSPALSPNTTYWVQTTSGPNVCQSARLRLFQASTEGYSTDLSLCSLSNAPSPLVVVAAGRNQIELAGSTNSNPVGTRYDLERSLNGSSGWVLVATQSASVQWIDYPLVKGTTYYYRALAYNSVNAPSAYTPVVSSVTLQAQPSDITDLVAVTGASEGSVVLSWTSPGSDGTEGSAFTYDIRVSPAQSGQIDTMSAFLSAARLTDVSSSAVIPSPKPYGLGETMTVLNLAPGNTFYFAIRGVDSLGNTGLWSRSAVVNSSNSALTLDFVPPAVPAFASSGDTQGTVSWTLSPEADADQYIVYVNTYTPAGPFVTTATVSHPLNSATILGLTNGNSYYYRVTVLDRGATTYPGTALESAPSNTVLIRPLPSPPSTPVLAGQAYSTSSILWTWTGGTPADGYQFYSPTGTVIASPSAGTTFYLQTGLALNTSYAALVTAYNLAGETASAPQTAYTDTLPPAGTEVSSRTYQSVGLVWSNNSSTQYQIHSSPDGSAYSLYATVSPSTGATTTAFVSGLSSNSTYYFRVYGTNGQGRASQTFDGPVSTRTFLSPPSNPPALTGFTLSTASVRWVWQDAATETGYFVTSATATVSPVLAANTTYWDESSLSPNTIYARNLIGVNEGGLSSGVSGSTATLANPPLSLLATAVSSDTVNLVWQKNANPDDTSYRVERSSDGSLWSAIASPSTSAYLDSGLEATTTYYFRVRAVNRYDVPTAYGNTFSTVTAPAPIIGTTTLLGVALSSDSIQWSWIDNFRFESSYQLISSTGGAVSPPIDKFNGTGTLVTYNESGLSPNTTVQRYLIAYNPISTVTSAVSSTVTFANTPDSLAYALITASSTALTWNAGGNPAYTVYRVQRSSNGAAYFDIGYTSATAFDSAGLKDNTSYWHRVSARNERGLLSAQSNVLQILTIVTAPGTITTLFADRTGAVEGQISLQWTAPGNNDYQGNIESGLYDIRWNQDIPINNDLAFQGAAFSRQISTRIVQGLTQTLVITGLTPGGTYFFAVKARDEVPNNYSAVSNSPFAWAQFDVTPPRDVFNLSFSSTGASTGLLYWTAPGDDGSVGTAAQYDIRYSTLAPILTLPGFLSAASIQPDLGGIPAPVIAGSTQSTLVVLSLDTTYYFSMRSRDERSNWSGISNLVTSRTPDLVPPGRVINPRAIPNTVQGRWIDLFWINPADPDLANVVIRFSTSGAPSEFDPNSTAAVTLATVPAGSLGYSHTGLTEGVTYYYTFFAYDAGGNYAQGASTAAVAPPALNGRPVAPTGLRIEVVGTRATIRWDPVTRDVNGRLLGNRLVGYRILRSLDAEGTNPVSYSISAASTTFVDQLASDIFYYRVIAVDGAGQQSSESYVVDSLEEVTVWSDDGLANLRVPKSAVKEMLARRMDLSIARKDNQEGGKVLKSYEYVGEELQTEAPIRSFEEGVVKVNIKYTLQNGNLVAGSPGLIKPSASDGLKNQDPQKVLGVYWFNGKDFVKLGGKVDPETNTISLGVSQMGTYQIRLVQRPDDVLLTTVYPETITPNGDGYNDEVHFVLDNPGDLALAGSIYDVRSAKVGSLLISSQLQDTLIWDGKDSGGNAVPQGIYIYVITVGDKTFKGTVVVAK